jgi:O-succinylbenzoic acid--CoA ligase
MEATYLTSADFWNDRAPVAAAEFPGKIPADPELRGHVLFATSGSADHPRWIALSKSALRESAAAVNRHLTVGPDSCWGLALPTQHVGGFGVVARAAAADCALREFRGRWNAPVFAQWLTDYQVTHTSLVPAQVFDLVASQVTAPASLVAVVVGGGHLDAPTGQAARALGWPVLASYGMTEAGSQIATQGMDSLGTLYQPAPLPLLPIWQAETTPEQLLCIAGPALFSGWMVSEGAGWAFHPRPSPWHPTRDRVTLSERLLTPIGRADTQVKVLGELVDLESLERELADLSAGRLTPGSMVIVAVPDARAGHLLVPVFAESTDASSVTEALIRYAAIAPGFRRLLAPVRLDFLPVSPLGKPRRAEIMAAILPLLENHSCR